MSANEVESKSKMSSVHFCQVKIHTASQQTERERERERGEREREREEKEKEREKG